MLLAIPPLDKHKIITHNEIEFPFEGIFVGNMGGKESKEKNPGMTIPQLAEGCKLSKGALQLVGKAIEEGIDPTNQLAQAITEVYINGKKTITRRHLGELSERVDRARATAAVRDYQT